LPEDLLHVFALEGGVCEVEPGQIGAFGHAIPHAWQVLLNQLGESPAVAFQVLEYLVQPFLPAGIGGDAGDDAERRRTVASPPSVLLPGGDVIFIGENDLRALETGEVPGLGCSDRGDGVPGCDI